MDDLAAQLRPAATDLLARREHSRGELRAKLSRRFADQEALEQQLQWLAQEGYQSDRRFCEVFVRSRSQQGQGPQRIARELRQRGVSDALVRELLWESDVDWCEQLGALYRRRFGDAPIADPKERARRVRFLQYRGFPYDLIRDVVQS